MAHKPLQATNMSLELHHLHLSQSERIVWLLEVRTHFRLHSLPLSRRIG